MKEPAFHSTQEYNFLILFNCYYYKPQQKRFKNKNRYYQFKVLGNIH